MEPAATSRTGISLPDTMRAFVLDGQGLDHVGTRCIETPRPGPGQLVGRVDAAGICSSVIKVIAQGSAHTLMYGWDLVAHPAILGDEGVITVAAIGEGLADRFTIGGRYAVQPAIDAAPVTNRDWCPNHGQGIRKVAIGYTLPGLLAEYVLIGQEAIDAGCLIPLEGAAIPAAHAAIAEPISCVISAHAPSDSTRSRTSTLEPLTPPNDARIAPRPRRPSAAFLLPAERTRAQAGVWRAARLDLGQ